MENKLTIVMYHYVRDLNFSRFPEIKGLETKRFKKQIDFLIKNYNIISPERILENQLPEKAAILTFDDGYIDHYTNVFPILMENEISAVFAMPAKIIKEEKVLDVNKIHFVLASAKTDEIIADLFKLMDFYRGTEFNYPSNDELFRMYARPSIYDNPEVVFIKQILQKALPERLRNIITDTLFKSYINISEKVFCKELYINMDQIKLMKKSGMHFAHHGYDHYWLENLEQEEMKADIVKALEFFDGIIDIKQWIMCYPYGSSNESVREFIKSKGCKLGFGTKSDVADINKDDILNLPRIDTNDLHI